MKRSQLLILALVLALVVGWVYQHFFTFIENRNPRGETIVAFGDSITAGYGVARSDNYVSRLERMFGVEIVNAGVSGDTTVAARMRFDNDVLARNPKVVFLELGGNDFLQRVPKKTTRENLEYMIQKIHDRGAAVVLLGVGGTLGAGGVPSMMKDLAKQYDTAVVPNILDDVFGVQELMIDQIHPNGRGYETVARNIAPTLEREIPSVFDR